MMGKDNDESIITLREKRWVEKKPKNSHKETPKSLVSTINLPNTYSFQENAKNHSLSFN